MKCFLRNYCKHIDWCCNFCSLQKCQDRCKDKHESCKWFIDEPVSEEDEKGNFRLFRYEKRADGTYQRHYYSIEEINKMLEARNETKSNGKRIRVLNRTKVF